MTDSKNQPHVLQKENTTLEKMSWTVDLNEGSSVLLNITEVIEWYLLQ